MFYKKNVLMALGLLLNRSLKKTLMLHKLESIKITDEENSKGITVGISLHISTVFKGRLSSILTNKRMKD